MNNLPKAIEPLELIAPLPIQWEVNPGLTFSNAKCNEGTITSCKDGETDD